MLVLVALESRVAGENDVRVDFALEGAAAAVVAVAACGLERHHSVAQLLWHHA